MHYVILALFIAIVGCSSSGGGVVAPPPPPPPPPPQVWKLEWTPGICVDNFILYQRLGDGWISVGETTKSSIELPIEPDEEAEFTVAGVCKTGEHKGEWRSEETVMVKR